MVAANIQRMSQNYTGSVRKTTYLMNAPAFNKHTLTYYTCNQPIINTTKWDSADILAFSHIPAMGAALIFE